MIAKPGISTRSCPVSDRSASNPPDTPGRYCDAVGSTSHRRRRRASHRGRRSRRAHLSAPASGRLPRGTEAAPVSGARRHRPRPPVIGASTESARKRAAGRRRSLGEARPAARPPRRVRQTPVFAWLRLLLPAQRSCLRTRTEAAALDEQELRRVTVLLIDASVSHETHSAVEIEIARSSNGEQSVVPSTSEVQQVARPLWLIPTRSAPARTDRSARGRSRSPGDPCRSRTSPSQAPGAARPPRRRAPSRGRRRP
jgi:hypothetical protein